MSEFYEIGSIDLTGLDRSSLQHDLSKRFYDACLQFNNNIELKEIRQLNENSVVFDVVIFDCINTEIESLNPSGILPKERLAFVSPIDDENPPEILALRKNFPKLPHQNHVRLGSPVSICLYLESWNDIYRSWTPQLFIKRIFDWLIRSSKGVLHGANQPLEQLFFSQREGKKLLLPSDFYERVNDPEYIMCFEFKSNEQISGCFFLEKSKVDTTTNCISGVIAILDIEPVVHGPIEQAPATFSELYHFIQRRGSNLVCVLEKYIRNLVGHQGLDVKNSMALCLMIMIPMRRTQNDPPEKYFFYAFIFHDNLVRIGCELGILTKVDKKYFCPTILGRALEPDLTKLNNLHVEQLDVISAVDKETAREFSGIKASKCDFKGVLAGAGSLGSTLAIIWSKEAWGDWTLVDDDKVEPHNVVRHISKNCHIGKKKVNVVADLALYNYSTICFERVVIDEKIKTPLTVKVKEAIQSSELVVDVTTDLNAPRDLSLLDNIPRCISAFYTPSGNSSVVLIEDTKRRIRLDNLESQYYREIINNEWGEEHLNNHKGVLFIGAGCRDKSMIMSYEQVLLHGSLIAKFIRINSAKDDACIRIFIDFDDGSIEIKDIVPCEIEKIESSGWTVVIDICIRNKMAQLRKRCLPDETGGIIVGYLDCKVSKIYVVDVLPAPTDSVYDNNEFIRGNERLEEARKNILKRTANIVDYIGEWHSHPDNITPQLSSIDQKLIEELSEQRAIDGYPILVMIIGKNDEITANVKFAGEVI